MSGNHALFAKPWSNFGERRSGRTQSERDAALAQGKLEYERHREEHKTHDFVPDPDLPPHRLFFRPKPDPKKPRRIVTSGSDEAKERDEKARRDSKGLRGVRRIRVSGE